MDILDRLLEHDRWTTTRILAICGELPQAQLHTHFNIGLATIDATLRHMMGNVQVWTDLMRQRPVRPPDAVKVAGMDGFAVLFDALYTDFAACGRECRDEGRLDMHFVDNLDDPPTHKTYGGTIAHVISHNMHHRAEILNMLGQLNVPDLPEGDVLSWEAQARTD